jgi:hypothetical protein
MVQVALTFAFILLCVVGFVSARSGHMEAAPIPGLRSPRPMVIWTAWIGGLNLAVNVSSMVLFLFVFPSVVAALLFWLVPYSLVIAVIDMAIFVRERDAVLRSSMPPRRWAVTLVLSLSTVMFGCVVLCILLFHRAQLGNSFDPGGL